jgi:hypothetical protein
LTQPRKEQVKNLKTKYSSFNDNSVPIVPDYGQSRLDLTGTDYDNYIAQSFTKTPNGAREPIPAILLGSIQDPFSVIANSSMYITIAGVNGGTPILVTFLAGDLISINGVYKLTARNAAVRINVTVATYLMPSPVATAIVSEGYLKIISPTAGPDATITLTDSTPGIITALGFGPGTSVTASGSNPQRGILAKYSPAREPIDDYGIPDRGGILPFKLITGASVLTKVSEVLHFGNGIYNQDVNEGKEIYGRISWLPGPKLRIQSYAKGSDPFPSIVTCGSNFSAITPGSVLHVDIWNNSRFYAGGGGGGQHVEFDVTFGTISNRQDVIDTINNAWYNYTFVDGIGDSPGLVIITGKNPEPYNFDASRDDFILVINGTFYWVRPTGSTATEVFTSINSQIAGSGAIATIYTNTDGLNYVQIRTTAPDGNSKIRVLSGILNYISDTGWYFNITTLDKLGIPIGNYRASLLASPHGGTEILIRGMGNVSLQLSGNSGVMLNLGLPNIPPIVPKTDETIVIIPTILGSEYDGHIIYLLPELMEFGEVPQDIDEVEEQEATVSNTIPTRTWEPIEKGLANRGRLPVIGTDGKIDSRLIQNFFDWLSANNITLGARNLDPMASRLSIPHRSDQFYTLIWESQPVPNNGLYGPFNMVSRLYNGSIGNIVLTINARWDESSSLWSKDPGADIAHSTGFIFWGGWIYMLVKQYGTVAPWHEYEWDDTVFSFMGPDTSYLKLGGNRFTGVQTLAPRLNIPYASTNPSAYTLLFQSIPVSPTGGIPVVNGSTYRVYATNNGGILETWNAQWDGSLWNRDLSAQDSFKISKLPIVFYGGIEYVEIKHVSHVRTDSDTWSDGDANWGVIDHRQLTRAPTTNQPPEHHLFGTVFLGESYEPPFNGSLDYNIPRLTNRSDNTERTLIWQMQTDTAGHIINIYHYQDALEFVTNGSWTGSPSNLWSRILYSNVTRLKIDQTQVVINTKKSGNGDTWLDHQWDSTYVTFNPTSNFAKLQDIELVFSDGTPGAGSIIDPPRSCNSDGTVRSPAIPYDKLAVIAKNTCRAWADILLNNPSVGADTITVNGAFGITSVNFAGSPGSVYLQIHTSGTFANVCPIASVGRAGSFCSCHNESTNIYDIYVYTASGILDITTSVVDIHFVLFGSDNAT